MSELNAVVNRDRAIDRIVGRLLGFPGRYRRGLVVGAHLILVALSNYLAFWLRFDGAIPARETDVFYETLLLLVLVRGITFAICRLHEGLWRYASLWDLRNITNGVVASSLIFYVMVHELMGRAFYPRSVFILDSILLVCLMGGLRLTPRIYKDFSRLRGEKRVLIFGAGDAGEMLVRDLIQNPAYEYEPIGFIDDDTTKVGQRIHGVPVLGTREDFARIVATKNPHEVLVAIPSADPALVRGIVTLLEPFKVPIKTLPNLRDIVNGTVTVSQMRSLSIEDLLARAPVGLDTSRLAGLIRGARVLVTGAGGSIGSELCRQIAALGPSALVLFERYENGLYAIENDLLDRQGHPIVRAVLGDVTDAGRLDGVFAEHRPDIVFHAAAHKHVPMMESNPCEAVKNNVTGTRLVVEAAERHGVSRFVLISTDKAVNPTSVMGATKRVAELLVQGMADQNGMRLVTVRFGNVLASNGSVVPRFVQQIKAGGPVTVTDPEIRRYFMLIPEAVQLVLQAAALAEGGETFVLEMGEQIKVADLARKLIRLSGFVPDEEIPIQYVGLRPGEKLFEELVAADEVSTASPIKEIIRVRARRSPDPALLAYQILELERLASADEGDAVVGQLERIVPAFEPDTRPVNPHSRNTRSPRHNARPSRA